MAGPDLIPEGVKRPVAVFAHPDDESLWCGGLLYASDMDWTVICCSIPPHDRQRAWKFFDACEALAVRGVLMPFEEGEGLNLSLLDLGGYDFIVTHGEAGEYGHRHHVQLHAHIKQRWGEKARYIGYGGEGRFTLSLDDIAKRRKLEALQCYDRESNGEPQWKHLIANYGRKFDLWNERYD